MILEKKLICLMGLTSIFSQSSGDPFQVQLEIRGVQANFMDVWC